MSDRAPPPTCQLLLYRFGPTAAFEGQLVGALERIETGGAMRVLDALFVSADADTGELSAVGLRGTGAGAVARLLLETRPTAPPGLPHRTRMGGSTAAGGLVSPLPRRGTWRPIGGARSSIPARGDIARLPRPDSDADFIQTG